MSNWWIPSVNSIKETAFPQLISCFEEKGFPQKLSTRRRSRRAARYPGSEAAAENKSVFVAEGKWRSPLRRAQVNSRAARRPKYLGAAAQPAIIFIMAAVQRRRTRFTPQPSLLLCTFISSFLPLFYFPLAASALFTKPPSIIRALQRTACV